MGTTCSVSDSASQIVSAAKNFHAARGHEFNEEGTTSDEFLTSAASMLRYNDRRKKKKNTKGQLSPTYDIDEDESLDTIRVPPFAREMMVNLYNEEAAIDSEDIDPILLTKIRPNSLRYEFVRENNTRQIFRAESLIDYMIATRHFHDPETRIEFSDEQLKELDVLGAQLGKPSVYEAKTDGAWMRKKLEDDVDAFTGVERCCDEHIYRMLRIIEHTKLNMAQEGEVSLLTRCFPYYQHYISLMFNLDKEATMVTIDQYKRFLKGPPNHPTVDRTGGKMLKFVFDFLDEVTKDLWITDERERKRRGSS